MLVASVALAFAGCKQQTDPNKGRYSCAGADDCGGGYECRMQFSGGGLCYPNGQCVSVELCNGIDDNCDGRTDESFPTSGAACMTGKSGPCGPGTNICVDAGIACANTYVPVTELCNGIDDNCNGSTDEIFDLTRDNANCGACSRACSTGANCTMSICVETNCSDGIDNDHDGGADCLDPACVSRACGGDDGGWNCGRVLIDAGTDDGGTDDGGMVPDAGDVDAGDLDAGMDDGGLDAGFDGGIPDAGPPAPPSAAACTPRESICDDGLDDDLDGRIDCADSDCEGLTCASGKTCTGGTCQ